MIVYRLRTLIVNTANDMQIWDIVKVFECPSCTQYSETSDSGLSQIWTQYNKRFVILCPCLSFADRFNLSTKDTTYCPSIFPTIHFEPLKEDHLSTKNKSAELCFPKVSFIQRSHSTFLSVTGNSVGSNITIRVFRVLIPFHCSLAEVRNTNLISQHVMLMIDHYNMYIFHSNFAGKSRRIGIASQQYDVETAGIYIA